MELFHYFQNNSVTFRIKCIISTIQIQTRGVRKLGLIILFSFAKITIHHKTNEKLTLKSQQTWLLLFGALKHENKRK